MGGIDGRDRSQHRKELAPGGSIRLTRNAARAGGIAVALMLLGGSGALAQNCTPTLLLGTTTPIVQLTGTNQVVTVPAAAASIVAGALGSVSTAFLSQQTSAFVVGARADQPDQAGGGVWMREVGGHVATKSDTTISTRLAPANEFGDKASTTSTCASRIEQNFLGVQVGTDVARLNSNGWNVHVGLTAGYLELQGRDVAQSFPPPTVAGNVQDIPSVGSINNSFQVPIIGGYVVATKGGFFSDLTVRRELYNISLNQPAISLNDQQFGARAWSVSAGAGYNFGLQDGWFVEPSAGVIWSRTQVDPFALAGPNSFVNGTLAMNDIDSLVGRATLRLGRTFTSGDMTWTPFGSASVFREFAPSVNSTFQTCANCAFGLAANPLGSIMTAGGAFPTNLAVTTSTTRIGTFGQFSAGLAGQPTNTGWVGFVRGDYRIGQNIAGWTANAGLRYNFVPEEAVASKMLVKAPRAVALAYDWTGFYLGGHLGIAQGRGHVDFVGTGVTADPYMAGWLAGGQIGYNVQYGPYVLGIEVDASKTNADGTRTCGASSGRDAVGNLVAFSPLFLTCQNALDWITTAAVRLGTTLPWSDRTLLYVKGGGAVANENVSVSCIFGANNLNVPSPFGVGGGVSFPLPSGMNTLGPAPISLPASRCLNSNNVFTAGGGASQTIWGGMVGFGSEFGLTREWSAKAELNYIWFGNRDGTASDAARLGIGAAIAEAKIGLNYRFGQGGSALAADMRPPPAPVEISTWSGGYVGVNLGGGWRQPADFVTAVPPCTDPRRPTLDQGGTCLLFAEETGVISGLGTGPGSRGKGITGGFQIGYNYQAGLVVVGVEADWEYFKRSSFLAGSAPRTSEIEEESAKLAGFTLAEARNIGPMSVTNEASSTWLATVRGRLGLAWDRLLVYGTGGVAFTDLRYTQTLSVVGFPGIVSGPSAVAENTQTQTGGTVGGGAEYALWNNLSVRAEYLYAQFNGVSVAGLLRSVFPPTTTFTGSTGNLHDHIVRIGLNYKFGYGAVASSY